MLTARVVEAEFLSPEEVRQLVRRGKNAPNELRALGIPHQVVRGRVLVSRYHVRAWLEGRQTASREVNLEAVR